jgi:hypothetical protein
MAPAEEAAVSVGLSPDSSAALSAGSGRTNPKVRSSRRTATLSVSQPRGSGVKSGLASANSFQSRSSQEGSQQVPAPVLSAGSAAAANETTLATQKILAFSGGGWNSQSISAGLISGALQESGRGIDALLQPFQQVSGNSGGTWFLSLLAYSKAYVDSLSKISKNNAGMDIYPYNADLRAAFEALSLKSDTGVITRAANDLKSLKIDGSIVDLFVNQFPSTAGLLYKALVGEAGLSWSRFVNKYVYGYPYLKGGKLKQIDLDGPRLSWAGGKDLTFALAVNSTPAVLLDRGFSLADRSTWASPYEMYFSALAPDPQNSSWWTNFIAAVGEKPAALPLLVVSDASPDGKQTSSYAEFPFGPSQLNFKNNPIFGRQNISASIGQRFKTNGFSLLDATIASSSAAGLLAAPDTYVVGSANTDGISVYNRLANIWRKMSPAASFAKGNLASIKESRINPELVKKLSGVVDKRAARIVDGAYVDNTSVAYAIRQMQASSGVDAPFDVTLLMNSNVDPITGFATMPGGEKINGSVAVLFGKDYAGDPLSNGYAVPFDSLGQLRPPMPSAQVFDISAWDQVAGPAWSYAADNNTFSMKYYTLDVTTVANPILGISAGQKGKLHIIATNNSQSFGAPVTLQTLDEYDQNFTFARDALIAKGGWEAMKSAF